MPEHIMVIVCNVAWSEDKVDDFSPLIYDQMYFEAIEPVRGA
jgi:hypothetical protein